MSNPSFFLLIFLTIAISCFSPSLQKAVVAPIFKDRARMLYTIQVYLQTPLRSTKLHLHLGGSFTWVDCFRNYNSSTYRHIPCDTPLCDYIGAGCENCFQAPGPGCANNTCSLFPENPVTGDLSGHNAIIDSLALPESSLKGRLVRFPNHIFSCSDASILPRLAKGVTGLAGLGRTNYSLPPQVSTALSAPNYFALCLTGQRSRAGVAIFGSRGPYVFSSHVDLSRSLVYTPLVMNPLSTVVRASFGPSDEYFIGLTSIKVNGKKVPLNQTLLRVNFNNQTFEGGVKLSTSTPYTKLETSIYKAFTELFIKESSAMNLTVTKAVKPFSVCYAAKDVKETRLGPAVPNVDLVLQSKDVFWRISGANSMVRISRKDAELWCLGFIDGGFVDWIEANQPTPQHPLASIVIGGHQMEDNLLQFDLESSRLGFSSSLLAQGRTCADFKTA